MLRSKWSLLSLVVVSLTLTGCDKTKEALGLTRAAPDEMQVIERPPLSMPPGYGLRPPLSSQKAHSNPTPREGAEASLLKKANNASSDKSATESEILKKANADATDPDIRKKIANEEKKNKQSIGEQLAFWTDNKSNGQVIDPEEENEKYNGSPMPGQPKQKSNSVNPEPKEE